MNHVLRIGRGGRLVALLCSVGLSACVGAPGADGVDGVDGTDGASCTVSSDEDLAARITCPDGSEVVVPAGGACRVESGAGGVRIVCDDGSAVTLGDVGLRCDGAENRVGTLAELTLLNALGCAELSGDLILEGLLGVRDLPPLAFTAVRGSVVIARTYELETLSGLSSLETIEGDLFIVDNHRLTDLHGLDHVSRIGGTFELSGNPMIERFDAPALLQELGSIRIVDNDSLLEIYEVGANVDDLWIVGNPRLFRVSIGDVATIGGELVVSGNPRLLRLRFGLRLTRVAGDFLVAANESLVALEADSLASVGGDLEVSDTSLRDLWGLREVASVGGDARITNNATLSSCEVDWWLERVGGGVVGRTYSLYNDDIETCCSGSVRIDGVAPRVGSPGQMSTVVGGDLGTCGLARLEIGGRAADVTLASPSHLVFVVPAGLAPGAQRIAITTDAGTAAWDGFTVLP